MDTSSSSPTIERLTFELPSNLWGTKKESKERVARQAVSNGGLRWLSCDSPSEQESMDTEDPPVQMEELGPVERPMIVMPAAVEVVRPIPIYPTFIRALPTLKGNPHNGEPLQTRRRLGRSPPPEEIEEMDPMRAMMRIESAMRVAVFSHLPADQNPTPDDWAKVLQIQILTEEGLDKGT